MCGIFWIYFTLFCYSHRHIAHAKEQGKIITTIDVENQAHGRIEGRIVMATDPIDWMDKQEIDSWLGLRSIACVEDHREEISAGKKSVQKRYYLTEHGSDASLFQELIRQHWGIENQCHWVLDVTWKEDETRIRKANTAQKLALLRKFALNLLKADTTVKGAIRGKRLQATFDENILTSFLKLNISK
ncbi:MAG: putative transposase YbfD/YdcC [Rubritalea sp.]